MMVLTGEKGLECEICVDGMRLEHVSECGLDELVADEAECRRRVTRGRRIAGIIRSLITIRGLQLECVRVLHETLFVPVLMYVRRQ